MPDRHTSRNATVPEGLRAWTDSVIARNEAVDGARGWPAAWKDWRRSVVALVCGLSAAIREFSDAQHSDPALQADPVRDLTSERFDLIDGLAAACDAAAGRVGGDWGEVSATLERVHADAVQLARSFRDRGQHLLRATVNRDVNAVHRWLAGARLHVGPLESRLFYGNRDIDFEMNKAAQRRGRQNPRQNRLRCDPSDRSVWLDGRRLASGLEEDVFKYLEVLAERYPEPVTYGAIKKLVPTLPENQTRFNSVVDRLSRTFLKHIEVVRKTGRGHLLAILTD